MKVNLNMLQTFLSVAENASFRKAADQSHLSVPAVSMQIKRLEERLGTALFNRTSRRVELTTAGERLVASGRKAMAEIDLGLANIQQVMDDMQGRISIACVPTVASTRLPAILTTFAKKFPGVSVLVRELPNKEIVEAVRRREVDFGIGLMSDRTCELAFSPVCVDDYCAMLPKGYPHHGRASIPLSELCRHPLLKLASPSSFREHIDDALRDCGLSLETVYEFMHVNTLVAMAESGLGVALLPRIAVPAHSSLKTVRISNPDMSRTIATITSRDSALTGAATHLVKLCGKLIPSLEAPVRAPAKSIRRDPKTLESQIVLNGGAQYSSQRPVSRPQL